jgi:hypothetical protein
VHKTFLTASSTISHTFHTSLRLPEYFRMVSSTQYTALLDPPPPYEEVVPTANADVDPNTPTHETYVPDLKNSSTNAQEESKETIQHVHTIQPAAVGPKSPETQSTTRSRKSIQESANTISKKVFAKVQMHSSLACYSLACLLFRYAFLVMWWRELRRRQKGITAEQMSTAIAFCETKWRALLTV